MATGEGLATARAVARQPGIDDVCGEVRPQSRPSRSGIHYPAFGLLLSPLIAALAMVPSSVSVVLTR